MQNPVLLTLTKIFHSLSKIYSLKVLKNSELIFFGKFWFFERFFFKKRTWFLWDRKRKTWTKPFLHGCQICILLVPRNICRKKSKLIYKFNNFRRPWANHFLQARQNSFLSPKEHFVEETSWNNCALTSVAILIGNSSACVFSIEFDVSWETFWENV